MTTEALHQMGFYLCKTHARSLWSWL